ncbi:carbohydrate kinase family protein [Salipiger sp. 1_MG-2023]|uniref:carbohydrate kinase family protein n=1 Tax=Salipiger sp. 1_MG-2023 TaxID=3062665 RepID=UPI0026E32456|nr:carbohydrate kinase family protein [Salipiger sp. 1_MG-2023]MDO6587383.1 carbohydrate kinase family protein [Salipiger sp. 1_MG-2023]
MTPLATVGNVNVDLIMGPLAPWPEPGTEVICPQSETRVGGAAGNAALAWMALDVPFQIAAATGSDPYGDWLRAGFGAMSAGWPKMPGATTLSVGVTHPDGERTFLSTAGHLPLFDWPDVERQLDWEALAGGKLLLCGSFLSPRLADAYDALFDRCDALKIEVALDTGWPPEGWGPWRTRVLDWIDRSEIVLFNEIEAAAVTGRDDPAEALEALAPRGIAVIKRGPQGAVARQGTERASVAAPQVAVIDTIGAGDIFNAAFLAALPRGLQAAMDAGTACASRAVSSQPRRYMVQEVPA